MESPSNYTSVIFRNLGKHGHTLFLCFYYEPKIDCGYWFDAHGAVLTSKKLHTKEGRALLRVFGPLGRQKLKVTLQHFPCVNL